MRLLFPTPGRLLEGRAEIEEFYAPPAAPSVRANFVVSLDGAVEVDGQSAALGSPEDQALFASMRAVTDAILVGASTVRSESYGPAKVAVEGVERRRARGQAPIPTIAVVTRSADLDPEGHFFSPEPRRGIAPPRPIILTCEAAPAERRARLAEVADVAICGDETVDMATALSELRLRGSAQVLCEGGPTLLTTMVSRGLVDELCLTHTPVLAGPGHQSLLEPAACFGGGDAWQHLIRWRLVSLVEGGGLLFARYWLDAAR